MKGVWEPMRKHWKTLAAGLCACLALAGAAGAVSEAPESSAAPVSRGEFVEALYGAHRSWGGAAAEGTMDAPFRDVGAWSEYFPAVCWAKELGIAGGYGDGTFGLDEPVTRQQAAVMLCRYGELVGLSRAEAADLTGYEDAASVPAWCRDAVAWAVGGGLWFSGSGDRLNGAEPVTEEELETLMHWLFRGGLIPAKELAAQAPGLTLELVSASPAGARVRLENRTEETFGYGEDYGLCRQVNGGWYWVNWDMDVTLMGYRQLPGETRELSWTWEDALWGGTLPAGTYRIALEGDLKEGSYPTPGQGEPAAVSAEFTLP